MTPETTLLLVDGEESFRRRTAHGLASVGYTVETAATLEQARELLAKWRYRLVVLELRLPDGDGLNLLAEIRAASPSTEVVMLAGYATVPEGVRAIQQGAKDFLTKPCKPGELEAALEQATRQQRLERWPRTDGGVGVFTSLAEVERRHILRVLDECQGHRLRAARILGISERNLYRKLKGYREARSS